MEEDQWAYLYWESITTFIPVIKGLSCLPCPLSSFDDAIYKTYLQFLFYAIKCSYEYANNGWARFEYKSAHNLFNISFLFIYIQIEAKRNCSLEFTFARAVHRTEIQVFVCHSLVNIHLILYPNILLEDKDIGKSIKQVWVPCLVKCSGF